MMIRTSGPAEIVPTIVAAGGLPGRFVWDGGVSDELVRDGGYAAFGLFLIWCRRPGMDGISAI